MNAPRVEVEIVDAADVEERRSWGSRRMGQELEPELELLAHWMDSAFHIPGIGLRFGLDAIIGLIPGLGDTLTSLASLYILNAGRRYGVPRVTMLRMAANIAVDYLVGMIPLAGDAFDVVWKANQKNVALLRRHVLATPAEERRAGGAIGSCWPVWWRCWRWCWWGRRRWSCGSGRRSSIGCSARAAQLLATDIEAHYAIELAGDRLVPDPWPDDQHALLPSES